MGEKRIEQEVSVRGQPVSCGVRICTPKHVSLFVETHHEPISCVCSYGVPSPNSWPLFLCSGRLLGPHRRKQQVQCGDCDRWFPLVSPTINLSSLNVTHPPLVLLAWLFLALIFHMVLCVLRPCPSFRMTGTFVCRREGCRIFTHARWRSTVHLEKQQRLPATYIFGDLLPLFAET